LARARDFHKLQRTIIDNELFSLFSIGSVPILSLPRIFESKSPQSRGILTLEELEKGGGHAARATSGPGPQASKSRADDKEPTWHIVNTSPDASWRLPRGKQMSDFFKSHTSKAGFPKLAHHSGSGQRPMCVKYQVEGRCMAGARCANAHVISNRIAASDRKLIQKILDDAFGS
jgi:hypothetical protein